MSHDRVMSLYHVISPLLERIVPRFETDGTKFWSLDIKWNTTDSNVQKGPKRDKMSTRSTETDIVTASDNTKRIKRQTQTNNINIVTY